MTDERKSVRVWTALCEQHVYLANLHLSRDAQNRSRDVHGDVCAVDECRNAAEYHVCVLVQ